MTWRRSIGPMYLKKKSFIVHKHSYKAICITDLKKNKTKLCAVLEIYVNMLLQ